MLEGVRDLGLSWTDAARRFTARVELLREAGEDLPDMTEPALMDSLEDWLLPYLAGVKTAQDWKRFDILPALRAMLDWDRMQKLDAKAPAHFTTPLGRDIPIDYAGEHPEISLRLQRCSARPPTPPSAARPCADASVARRPPGADHDGPAGLLGVLLCGRAQGHARALPETPLARGSDRGRPDPARQAPRGLN